MTYLCSLLLIFIVIHVVSRLIFLLLLLWEGKRWLENITYALVACSNRAATWVIWDLKIKPNHKLYVSRNPEARHRSLSIITAIIILYKPRELRILKHFFHVLHLSLSSALSGLMREVLPKLYWENCSSQNDHGWSTSQYRAQWSSLCSLEIPKIPKKKKTRTSEYLIHLLSYKFLYITPPWVNQQ